MTNMAISNFFNFLSAIRCPRCKNRLIFKKNYPYCSSCGERYKELDGVFILNNKRNFSKQELKQVNYFNRHKPTTEGEYVLEEWHKSFLSRFLSIFKDVRNKTVVDLGPGQGYMTFELARAGAKVLAIDLSEKTLLRLSKIAKKKKLSKNICFICCSAENLSLRTGSVDIIVANAILEHLEKENEVIKEISRISKKSAGLMITVPLSFRYLFPPLIPIFWYKDKKIGHLRRYDEQTLITKFSPYGFKKQAVFYTGHPRKILMTFLSYLLKTHSLDFKIEEIDKSEESVKFWASNICMIFKK